MSAGKAVQHHEMDSRTSRDVTRFRNRRGWSSVGGERGLGHLSEKAASLSVDEVDIFSDCGVVGRLLGSG